MNKHRAEFLYKTAPALGINEPDALAIMRKAQTLHTWAVHECNGTIQREEKQNERGEWVETGRCHWYNPNTGNRAGLTSDRERGALAALAIIAKRYPSMQFEHQGDPRGYVLKIVKDGRTYGVPSEG